MTFIRVRGPHMLSLALLAGAALVPVGCGGGDGVSTYTVPKTTDSGKKDTGNPVPAPAAAGGDYRILGAMYPADNPVWFFKFSGPVDVVAKYEADFDKLTRTVKLQTDGTELPAFDVPAGWTRTGSRTVQTEIGPIKTDETFKFGPQSSLEVTITKSGGGVEQNLGRWVKMIGLKQSPNDKDKYTKAFDVVGGKGLWVDLQGPRNPATKGGPMMGGGLPPGHP